MAHSKWTAAVVRRQFLDFFKEKGHTIGTWWGSFGIALLISYMRELDLRRFLLILLGLERGIQEFTG